jgi:hypothetical protein
VAVDLESRYPLATTLQSSSLIGLAWIVTLYIVADDYSARRSFHPSAAWLRGGVSSEEMGLAAAMFRNVLVQRGTCVLESHSCAFGVFPDHVEFLTRAGVQPVDCVEIDSDIRMVACL